MQFIKMKRNFSLLLFIRLSCANHTRVFTHIFDTYMYVYKYRYEGLRMMKLTDLSPHTFFASEKC